MKPQQFLVPPFLKKLDRYLLSHYPVIWETKIHYILFYSTFLGNLVLFGAAFLFSAQSVSLLPYNWMASRFWGWGMLIGALILAYYAYQQSFVRIKAYTLRQNLLRYSLYLVTVASIYSNVMVLPHTLIFRIRQLYDYQTLSEDYRRLQKSFYSLDFIEKTFVSELNSAEQQMVLSKIENTPWLYRNQEYVILTRFFNDLAEIIKDKEITLKEDLLSVKRAILEHSEWPEQLRKNLVDRIDPQTEYILKLKHFKNCSFDLLNPLIQGFIQKYSLSSKTKERWYHGHKDYTRNEAIEILVRLDNLIEYHQADLFLHSFVTSIDSRGLFKHFFREGLKVYDEEVFVESHLSAKFLQNLDYLSDESMIDEQITRSLKDFAIEEHYSREASGLMLVFSALILLSAKLFTLRNIFIAGFSMIASFFLLVTFMQSDYYYIEKLRISFLGLFEPFFGKNVRDYFYRDPVFFFWLVPFLIMTFSAVSAALLNFKTIHFRWLQAMWVYILGSAIVSGFVTCAFLFITPRLPEDGHQISKMDAFTIFSPHIFIIYPLLLVSMFLMYAFYNHLTLFPKRK